MARELLLPPLTRRAFLLLAAGAVFPPKLRPAPPSLESVVLDLASGPDRCAWVTFANGHVVDCFELDVEQLQEQVRLVRAMLAEDRRSATTTTSPRARARGTSGVG